MFYHILEKPVKTEKTFNKWMFVNIIPEFLFVFYLLKEKRE